MRNVVNIILSAILLLSNTNQLSIAQQNDGRFLRGVKISEFTINGTDADFYVSQNGNDNWSGTLLVPNKDKTDGPFASIQRAKKAVRELKSNIYELKEKAIDTRYKGSPHKYGKGKDILVLIRSGSYQLDSTLVFTSVDGGERIETNLPTGAFEYHKIKDQFVTYAAYPDEHPIVIGGKEITNWKEEEKGVWSSQIDMENINELFINNKRQTLARYPNNGSLSMAEQPIDESWFKYKDGDIKNWDGIEKGRIRMKVRWGSRNVGISKVDEKNNIVYLYKPTEGMLYVPPTYYVENVEALLDTAGEWYFNSDKNILKIIPQEGISDPNKVSVVVPNISDLINIEGTPDNPVRNLRFYGLKFTITKPGGNAAIKLSYTKNCEVLKNEITNVSQTAISLGLGCYNNLISENKIIDVKNGSGIYNAGSPHPAKWEDINSDNKITFNEVENIKPQSVGIATRNTIRTVVAHNYVTNTGGYGITVGSWPNVEESIDGNHLVEFNHVSFTNKNRDDEGGIAVYGLSHGSIVRNNLIHDVTPAETNENVGLFFQNMSKGWTVIDNIYYNLKQGELKYCAAYPIDNIYEDNFVIKTPKVEPEQIIEGKPKFSYSDLNIVANSRYETGKIINITATVKNAGATGLENVKLYVDGKVAYTQKFPVIKGNERIINFTYRFVDPGKHQAAIENTPYTTFNIAGKTLTFVYNSLTASNTELPVGDTIIISADVKNVRNEERTENVKCVVDDKIIASKVVKLKAGESKIVEFPLSLSEGVHTVTIRNQTPIKVYFYPYKTVDITEEKLSQYCSGTAKPCEFNIKDDHYEITASGTDFLHAEDSYGTVFLKDTVKGDFIATVKVTGFGEGVSEWFRAGIFVRNDLTKSNEAERGSLGSFLMFTTPKRHGAQWDQFGDGSMHNTKSYNYQKDNPFPLWLKVIREGNFFTGYYSFDGKSWTLSRKSTPMTGLTNTMDIGLAAGTNDQRSSLVVFEDFKLIVEKK